MSTPLERALRRYIEEGSGVGHCLEGNSEGIRPRELYATLLFDEDTGTSFPIWRDLGDGRTLEIEYSRSIYSLQFYRRGAVAAARRFARWVRSEVGISQAQTAFADGKIDRLVLVRGGAGYGGDPPVSFQGGHGTGAAAYAIVTGGTVTGLRLTDRGDGYVDSPDVGFGGGGNGAAAVALGCGFRVVVPLRVRRLDSITGDAWEERAQIDLSIDHATDDVQDTGRIDTFECTLVAGGEILR